MSARTALLVSAGLVLLAVTSAVAGRTRTWEQSRFEEFQKGTSKGVALRSDGALELAPAFKTLSTTPSTYIWAAASDPQGNVYAAAGSPARVYRITPAGQTTVLFEPQELQVQTLVIAPDGVIYAATSPDGKVYKIERKAAATAPAAAGKDAKLAENGQAAEQAPRTVTRDESYSASVFFDPKTKYIWHLALDNEGRLYVATGDAGQIFRVSRTGESSVFFKSDEAHIRVLAFDRGGNLIAGSDGSGLVYRISPAGEGFVLYSAPKKEITALAIDEAGNIFAAGAGEKRLGAGVMSPSTFSLGAAAIPQPQPPAQSGTIQVQTTPAQPQPTMSPMPTLGMPSTGSEIYMIAPDGSPRRIWQSRDDLVYALGFDGRKRLLAGTGNKGRIYAIQRNGDFTDLVKASATQITAFAPAAEGGLYAASSNLGKIFLLGAGASAEGSFDSDVFDARNFSAWGRVEARGSGGFQVFTRSGNVDNPDRHWSEWKQVDLATGAAVSPAARFLQWRAVLQPGENPTELRMMRIHYLPKNVAPVVEDVAAAAGVRFQPMPRVQAQETATLNVGNSPPQAAQIQTQRFEMAPPAVRDPNAISARWAARDENDDDLVYTLYYRGDRESRWKLLAENISDKHYTWDAGLFPDGGYTLKVVASDAPSNALDAALTDERESQRFEVDNAPPAVQGIAAALAGDGIRVTFRASDSFSAVARAEYSVNAGEWHSVRPVGEVSDSLTEEYSFLVPIKRTPAPPPPAQPKQQKRPRRGRGAEAPPPAESATPAEPQEFVIVVRVYDRFDNLGTAKTIVTTQ